MLPRSEEAMLERLRPELVGGGGPTYSASEMRRQKRVERREGRSRLGDSLIFEGSATCVAQKTGMRLPRVMMLWCALLRREVSGVSPESRTARERRGPNSVYNQGHRQRWVRVKGFERKRASTADVNRRSPALVLVELLDLLELSISNAGVDEEVLEVPDAPAEVLKPLAMLEANGELEHPVLHSFDAMLRVFECCVVRSGARRRRR